MKQKMKHLLFCMQAQNKGFDIIWLNHLGVFRIFRNLIINLSKSLRRQKLIVLVPGYHCLCHRLVKGWTELQQCKCDPLSAKKCYIWIDIPQTCEWVRGWASKNIANILILYQNIFSSVHLSERQSIGATFWTRLWTIMHTVILQLKILLTPEDFIWCHVPQ